MTFALGPINTWKALIGMDYLHSTIRIEFVSVHGHCGFQKPGFCEQCNIEVRSKEAMATGFFLRPLQIFVLVYLSAWLSLYDEQIVSCQR